MRIVVTFMGNLRDGEAVVNQRTKARNDVFVMLLRPEYAGFKSDSDGIYPTTRLYYGERELTVLVADEPWHCGQNYLQPDQAYLSYPAWMKLGMPPKGVELQLEAPHELRVPEVALPMYPLEVLGVYDGVVESSLTVILHRVDADRLPLETRDPVRDYYKVRLTGTARNTLATPVVMNDLVRPGQCMLTRELMSKLDWLPGETIKVSRN